VKNKEKHNTVKCIYNKKRTIETPIKATKCKPLKLCGKNNRTSLNKNVLDKFHLDL